MRILGKGKTGLAIKEIYSDAKMYDDNNKDSFDINSDELTVVSPGIPPSNYLVKNSKNLVSEYDLFESTMPFNIWISGTNGKTTTTQMLQHILKDKGSVCGGNIGTPLAKLDINSKIWILETSSFTLHYTNKAKPNIYILLPISDDHCSWHGSFKEYEHSKLKPLDYMKKDDIAIIPARYNEYKTDAKVYTYSNSKDLSNIFNIDIKQIKFKEPFLLDSLLALSIEKILFNEISYQKINNFIQDPHKLEEFKDKSGRLWIDDSKATNIDATIQALKTYKDKKIYLILGGDDKDANLNPLFEQLVQYDVELYAIGKNSDKLDSLSKRYNLKLEKMYQLKNAVEKIANRLTKQSVALLSPAAASFDQFDSYKQRGEKYKEFINSFMN
ncbi:MAG: UDP-N-acetylmuramoyl-L-alanine--D-glutamate ligase [Campylobacterota bacterium]|nr:UDP-N-acetylmuramoyl-L-alanine--D-glutamate ligase [Campylobacterota bacterium]